MTTPLKRLRTKRGVSQEAVAGATGIDQSTISRIENGAPTTPENATKLVEYFGREQITELHILYPERYPADPEQANASARAAAT